MMKELDELHPAGKWLAGGSLAVSSSFNKAHTSSSSVGMMKRYLEVLYELFSCCRGPTDNSSSNIVAIEPSKLRFGFSAREYLS